MKTVKGKSFDGVTGPKRHGFTLVELLVVLGIIIILMGILLPVIARVKETAYATSTASEVSQLSLAINQYYADFHAYPGPLSDYEISVPAAQNPLVQNKLLSPNGLSSPNGDATPQENITGSENLVLGLLGGLSPDTLGDGYQLMYNPSTLGLGPLCLNPLNPQRSGAYLNMRSQNWLDNGIYYDQAGRHGDDTNIPEFVDQFPDDLQIIYVRAHVGAKNVCEASDAGTYNSNNSSHNYSDAQYNVNQIWNYVLNDNTAPPGYVGLPQPEAHGLRNFGSMYSPSVGTYNQDGTNSNGAWDLQAYLTNPSSPNLNQPIARGEDTFILIAAGKNRTFGSIDDITSFGSR